MTDKLSKVEATKAASRNLRGEIAADLAAPGDQVGGQSQQLLKFHGLYQQDDRDQRKASRVRSHSFMLRTRIPGGQMTADQYLVHDDLASRYGNDTLRITTRQCFQLHGLLKGNLKQTIRSLNHVLVTSLGACGDVVRNVMCCPAPIHHLVRDQIAQATRQISDHLLPRTRAYHEIWIDGEKVVDGEENVEDEPIYGKTYLPRKFKIAVAYPGDNCVDVYTNDIGLVAIADGGTLLGFNVLVGGGMGMTHNKPDTYPRLADPLGFVTPDQLVTVVAQIVMVQRDYGDRSDRKHARLKYVIADWGVERFHDELAARLGYRLRPVAPMPPMDNDLHLGWQEQGDGRWFLGISVENGRIRDDGDRRLRSGLRALVERYRPDIRLTPNQDILFTGVAAEDRGGIDSLLASFGIVQPHALTELRLYSLACPALPTCGLALAEAERALPGIVDELEVEAARLGLHEERITVRMTGCPNGCARPYMADLAFVGRSADQYVIFVGGRGDGTRLNQPYRDLVHRDDLIAAVRPLLVAFQQTRQPGESFGDFCHRTGIDALQTIAHQFEQKGMTNGHAGLPA